MRSKGQFNLIKNLSKNLIQVSDDDSLDCENDLQIKAGVIALPWSLDDCELFAYVSVMVGKESMDQVMYFPSI